MTTCSISIIDFLSANSQSEELIQRVKERYFPVPEEELKQKLISSGFDINHWEIGGHSWILKGLSSFMKYYMTHLGSIERSHFTTLKNYDQIDTSHNNYSYCGE